MHEPGRPIFRRTLHVEGLAAVGALHLVEAVALDGDVEFLTRVGQLTLRENLGRRRDPRAVADLGAGGDEIAAAIAF